MCWIKQVLQIASQMEGHQRRFFLRISKQESNMTFIPAINSLETVNLLWGSGLNLCPTGPTPLIVGKPFFFDAIGIKEFLQKRLDLIFHNLHGMEIHGSWASSWMISYVVSIIFVNFIHICGRWIHFDLNIFFKWVRFFQRQLDAFLFEFWTENLTWKPGEFQLRHGISPCDMTALSRYLLPIGLVVLWSMNRCEVLNHENFL